MKILHGDRQLTTMSTSLDTKQPGMENKTGFGMNAKIKITSIAMLCSLAAVDAYAKDWYCPLSDDICAAITGKPKDPCVSPGRWAYSGDTSARMCRDDEGFFTFINADPIAKRVFADIVSLGWNEVPMRDTYFASNCISGAASNTSGNTKMMWCPATDAPEPVRQLIMSTLGGKLNPIPNALLGKPILTISEYGESWAGLATVTMPESAHWLFGRAIAASVAGFQAAVAINGSGSGTPPSPTPPTPLGSHQRLRIQGWDGVYPGAAIAWGSYPVCIWNNENSYGWVYSCGSAPSASYDNYLSITTEADGQLRIWSSDKRQCLRSDTDDTSSAYPYANWTSACSETDTLFEYTADHQLMSSSASSSTGVRYLVFGYSTLYYGLAYGTLGLPDHAAKDDLYTKWKFAPNSPIFGN